MKIEDVRILNWTGPAWWDEVEAEPDQPLITATLTMVLTYKEYQALLERDKAERQTANCEGK